MSEIIPPSKPGKETPSPVPTGNVAVSKPLSKGACAAIGAGLFIGSSLFAIICPPVAVAGLAAAIASLFIKGYRCIFVGYILTVGVILLVLIAYCSTHPFRMD